MRTFLCVSLFLVATSAFASDLRHVEDASLRSVFFIDPQEGWIVGDEGVILHTINSGKQWERQITGTRASLRSVQFLTPFIGWAVGREELPYGMGAVGVILFTNDGGLEWKKQLPNTLPGLNQVRFVDAKTGFLCGDGSDQFPFGVFKTTDSGRSWEPIAGPRTTSWLTGDFRDADTGILAGAWSRLAVIGKGQSAPVRTVPSIVTGGGMFSEGLTDVPKEKTTLAEHSDWLAGRDITSMQILGKKTIAVGQGGMILTSASDGKAWGFTDTKLPTKVLANLDFHAVAAVKEKIWIAGRPGSVLLHSSDGGATWSFQKTGQPLPLHSVFFFDEKIGFAVGDAGTVLASNDGGKSWAIQHQAGTRAGKMVIHSLNKNAPVDLLTQSGLVEGFLTTALRVTAPETATVQRDRLQDSRRYAAAIRSAGGMTGETLWHFPMPQHLEGCDKRTILAHWNRPHKDHAQDELLRQLVLALRIWRPTVVMTEHPKSDVPLSALVGEAVEEACRRAEDPKAFPEQIDELGLAATCEDVVIFGLGNHERPANRKTFLNDEPFQRLQGTVREYGTVARALLTETGVAIPLERPIEICGPARFDPGLRLLTKKAPTGTDKNTREIGLEEPNEKFAQAILERRRVVALAENLADPTRALAILPIALDKLPDESAAQAAFTIAGRFADKGQWYLAQEFYLYLVDRAPAHPLSAGAYRWLLRLNTSSEARRRHELKHFSIGAPIALTNKKGPPLVEEKVVKVGHIVKAGNEILSRSDVRDWNKGSVEWMKRLSSYGAVHAFDARAQFCLQSAKRQLGDAGASYKAMDNFRKFVPSGPWHDAARAERWLTDRSEAAPRNLGRARYTEVRPYLDGKLDDPCWQNLKPMILDNAVGDTTKHYTTATMFAFDQEFLYLALKCTHPAGQQVAPVRPRPRDADVDGFDRISILLDLDRDYGTYYHLEVDQRGCVRDGCWGDKGWNPRWFVAVLSTETNWQIEAAIPLGELTSDRLTQGSAWAFNVVRVLPGRGVQSWSLPADVEPRPEGMSLLLFQTGNVRPMPVP